MGQGVALADLRLNEGNSERLDWLQGLLDRLERYTEENLLKAD